MHNKPKLVEYPNGNPNGTHVWFLNNKIHRTDGPAYEGTGGTCEWWLNGVKYSFDYWCKLTNKTEEEIAKLKEQYLLTKLKKKSQNSKSNILRSKS